MGKAFRFMTDVISAYPAISLRDVTHIYKLPRGEQRVAVEHLSLDVPCGGVFGFLGANGAGKTTTIKMLLGFLSPTEGKLEIFGEPCREYTTRRHVGYLPETPCFHPFLSPLEVLRIHCELIGLDRVARNTQIEEVVELTHLGKNKNLPLSKLSKGNQQRVGIAQALLGQPRLLILDEPTSGLDPIARHEMRDIIAQLRANGRTVFLSSHVLSEIDTLCDHVGILNHGRLVACGTPGEIKQHDIGVRIVTSHLNTTAERDLTALGAQIDITHIVTIRVPSGQEYAAIHILEANNLPLVSVSSSMETLEAAFLRLAA